MAVCGHLDQIAEVTPSSPGCEDCLASGRHDWVHLRVCQECGHVGCCDNSPARRSLNDGRRLAEAPAPAWGRARVARGAWPRIEALLSAASTRPAAASG